MSGLLLATLLISLIGQCFIPHGHLVAALLQGQRVLRRRRSAFGRLAAAVLRGQRVLSAPLISLVGYGLCSRCSCLSLLLLRECRTQAAVLLVSQTCESGLALLLPQSLVGELDVEVAVAKPQEDSAGCCHLLCKSSVFAMSSLLVEKALRMCSLLIK
jgi:hypothetical protein